MSLNRQSLVCIMNANALATFELDYLALPKPELAFISILEPPPLLFEFEFRLIWPPLLPLLLFEWLCEEPMKLADMAAELAP